MPEIVRTAPCLMTKDPEAQARFYLDKLGFDSFELYGRPGAAFFAIALRNRFQIMFRYVRDGRPRRPWIPAADEPAYDVYITVDDVDTLYEEFVASGALPSQPEDKIYGMRELRVVDPEGYVLVFGADMGPGDLKPYDSVTKD